MHKQLPTLCFKVALLMSGRKWESWAYFHFMVSNLCTQHKLVDFYGHVTLLHLFYFIFWFHDFFKKKLILTWEGYKCVVKLLNEFLISQNIYVSLLQFSLLFLYNIYTIFLKIVLHKNITKLSVYHTCNLLVYI